VFVGVREFARIKGVTPGTVSSAIRGRLADAVVMDNGRPLIDVNKGLALWDSRTRRNGSEKLSAAAKERDKRQVAQKPVLPTKDQISHAVASLPEDAIPGLEVSRERKEHYQAELARVNAMKERGELVVAEEVKKAAFTLGRTLRDQMMGIPERVAGQLAATTDVREVFKLLDEEIRLALRCLADG
jgi:predicted transcriptional regulator